jgi:hypothetical protein
MNDEHKQLKKLDRVAEGHESGDKSLKGETINSKIDNARQEKQKMLDAARSYKLTGEGQLSFQITLDGKEIEAKDRRSPRTNMADGSSAGAKLEPYGSIDSTSHEKNEQLAILSVDTLPGRQSEDILFMLKPSLGHGDDGLSVKPIQVETITHRVLKPNGEIDEVFTTKNSDGSSVQKTTRPNGDIQTVSTDAQGREIESVKTHNGLLGEIVDERRVTHYDTITGWPEATTTHYNRSGRETDRVSEDAFGNSHVAKYQYTTNGQQCKSEQIDLDRSNGTRTDTKYDANNQRTEKTTQYSDGRPADRETWLRGPDGIVIHEKNGRITPDEAYLLRDGGAISDRRQSGGHIEHGERGLNRPDEHTRKLIDQKEHELHDKYGVTFSKPGEDLGAQTSLTGKRGQEMHARYPTMLELNAIEKALEKSDPAYKTADGHAVKFSFADKQFHDGPPADADSHPQDSGAVEIRIFPEGVTNAHNRTRPLENEVIHELAHNTIFKKDKMGDVMPSEITSQIGFYEVPDDPSIPKIVRGEHGTLWRHFPGDDDPMHWWTEVNATGKEVTTDGKPRNDHNLISESFSKHHTDHPSLIEAKDGSFYSHELSNGDPARYWIKCDKEGHPLDKAGHAVDNDSLAYAMNNSDMRATAKMHPCTNYFDNAQEATAEAIAMYRMDMQSRKELEKISPEYYKMAKAEDQKEINNQYGVNPDGSPRCIRLPWGKVVTNDANARAEVQRFESAS